MRAAAPAGAPALESLNLAADNPGQLPLLGAAAAAAPAKANDVRAVIAPGESPREDAAACGREKEELTRLRANPDRQDAERFAREMSCDALKPQAERLLEKVWLTQFTGDEPGDDYEGIAGEAIPAAHAGCSPLYPSAPDSVRPSAAESSAAHGSMIGSVLALLAGWVDVRHARPVLQVRRRSNESASVTFPD